MSIQIVTNHFDLDNARRSNISFDNCEGCGENTIENKNKKSQRGMVDCVALSVGKCEGVGHLRVGS